MRYFITIILLILSSALFAEDPVVKNVRFEQRTDGSLIVDIYYDVIAPEGTPLNVFFEASDDNGQTWDLHCESLLGEQGRNVTPGRNRHTYWDFFEDNPWVSGDDYRIRVTAYEAAEGFIITEDTTLVEDIEVPPGAQFAIKINASNVTLDLGGHTISGSIFSGSIEVAENLNNITIRNGTLEGFLGAVSLCKCDSVTFENLTIRNLDITDPNIFVIGIGLSESEGSVIKDIYFEFPSVAHKEAIVLDRTDAAVSNIEMHGGSVGVDFGGIGCSESKGSLRNSKFYDLNMEAALVQTCNGVEITDNLIVRNVKGIITEGFEPSSSTGLVIKRNIIRDGGLGIFLAGSDNSIITDNLIINNRQEGISIYPSIYEDIFYSTSNIVSDNIVVGNTIDLSHHENCLGNTWERNVSETKQGEEIPDYVAEKPATAREFLAKVDSAAAEITSDAQLLKTNTFKCDTTGNAMRWLYIYGSAAEQKKYEIWLVDGQIITLDTISRQTEIYDDNLPLPETWIDSDSAMVIAEEMGGKGFRERHEIENIFMDLTNTWGLNWNVFYAAEDTVLNIYFDASM